LAAEDEDDVVAMRAAALEAKKDLDEFDESAAVVPDPDEEGGAGGESGGAGGEGAHGQGQGGSATSTSSSSSSALVLSAEASALAEAAAAEKEEKDLESEFASWQASVGPDFKALEAALKPVERYALKIRTEVDPYYSIFFVTEQARLAALTAGEGGGGGGGEGEVWDVEEIERQKEEEELRALSDGELLATTVTKRDLTRFKTWYLQERSRRVAARRMRTMTGGAWVLLTENGISFWYNNDTGASTYATPAIIIEQERMQHARERGYNAMPLSIMLLVCSYLEPYPERCKMASLCARWAEAAMHPSFRKRVLPVESGARDPAMAHKLTHNIFASVEAALRAARPGDTIELGLGHHWESTLLIDKPVRIMCAGDGGDDTDSAKCVVELLGQIVVAPSAGSVVFYGFSVRRPRKVATATSCLIAQQSKLSVRKRFRFFVVF
jgi:hypothetical protein